MICDHDHPVRNGRANYLCLKCDEDIKLALVFMQEAIDSQKD